MLSSALAGSLGVLMPVYLILFGGGVLIALAGFFGWLALPAPTPTVEEQSGVAAAAQSELASIH